MKPRHPANRPTSRSRLISIAAALVVAAAAGAGASWLLHSAAHRLAAHDGHGQAETTYACPMHPSYKSDHPGNCPICSMKLVPVGTRAEVAAQDAPRSHGASPAPAANGTAANGQAPSIQITPERQQQIGVRFATIERVPAAVEVHAVGVVAFDESRITHVHTKVNGWIEEVFVDFVGAPVKKGQPLFTIYSPDLVASQQEYLLALRAERELGQSSFDRIASGSRALVESARQRLRLWDMTQAQIQSLEKRGEVSRTVTVFSPTGGVVTERAAYHHGRYVTPELDLYTIVNLERVWVTANVYEHDLPNVAPGQEAEATFPSDPAHAPLRGAVNYVQPFLDPATRTARVRFDFPNPDGELRPETFVNVVLRKELAAALVVPVDAVMDTGQAQYVFVDRGSGSLEPRRIRTGPDVAAGRIVLEGLREGERVVTAANFIVDSESRLKGAFDAMRNPGPSSAVDTDLRAEVDTKPSPAEVGENELRVRLSHATGAPVAGAEVDVRLSMPAMGSMPPLESNASLREEEPGLYVGRMAVPMAGTWETTVQTRMDGRSLGSVHATLTAR